MRGGLMTRWRDLGRADYEPEKDFDPTDEPAGSWEKVEILRKRLERGAPLHHPEDNPIKVDPPIED